VYYYQQLMAGMRAAIEGGTFASFVQEFAAKRSVLGAAATE
jgi:queuine/archaeosine tRNA-ribosyltransferase